MNTFYLIASIAATLMAPLIVYMLTVMRRDFHLLTTLEAGQAEMKQMLQDNKQEIKECHSCLSKARTDIEVIKERMKVA